MFRILVIAAGGAIGSAFRYIVSDLDYKFSNGIFPVSTLIVNVTGSLVIGFLWGIFDRFVIPPDVRLFIFIGILGGYTTFSTFSLETFNLMRDGEYKIAAANVIFSNALSIAAVFLAYFVARLLMNLFD